MIYILGFFINEVMWTTLINHYKSCVKLWVLCVSKSCFHLLYFIPSKLYHYLTCSIHLYELNLVASLKKIVQTVTSIILVTAAAAKSRQLCPTLCDPIDSSPPGSRPWDSPVISFSSAWKWKVKVSVPMDCSPSGSSVHGTVITKAMQKIALCQNQYLCHILNISRGSQLQFCWEITDFYFRRCKCRGHYLKAIHLFLVLRMRA